MTSPSLHVGPSSWDRDMQGLDEDVESENLAALGMHIAGKDDDDKEDEDEEEEVGVEKAIADESKESDDKDEEDKDEPEELDELKELDRLEEELQSEEGPVLVDEEET